MHPTLAATFLCTRCGTYGCPGCIFSSVARKEICRACATQGLGEAVPWERRKLLGRWRAFWATTRLASREPTRFFRTPATEEGIMGPVLYGIAAYTFGQFVYAVILVSAMVVVGLAAAIATKEPEVGAMIAGYSVCWAVLVVPLTLLQAPIYGLMGILLGGGLSHVTLSLGKKTAATFEDTLRAVSFANAPYFYYFIPCVGPLVAWVWMLVIETIAIREVHRVGTGRAMFAVLAYRSLFLFGILTLYAMLAAFVYYAGQAQH